MSPDKDSALWALAGLIIIGFFVLGVVGTLIDNIKDRRSNGKSKKTHS